MHRTCLITRQFAGWQHSSVSANDLMSTPESDELKPDQMPPDELQGNVVPLWTPRFWNGMTLGDYARLVCHNLLLISPSRWHLALITLMTATINSGLGLLQLVLFGHAIQRKKLPQQPVFVIGHFRTGTTMLLEYLACDRQFCWPTTYQCFAPKHFLVTQWFIPFLMVKERTP